MAAAPACHSPNAPSARLPLLLLLAAGLLCRLAYVGFTPTFYAPDEQSHYHYIQHLAEQRAFPVLNSKLGDARHEWEYSQPPLYYALLAPVFAAARALGGGSAATVIVLRAASVLLWLLNLWLGAALLRRMHITDATTRVLVFGLVCLLPTYTFSSATINNDNLLIPLGTAALCLMARRPPAWKDSIGLGLVLGLALLTKQSAVVLLPAVALLAVVEAIQQRLSWSAAGRHLLLALGLAGLIFLPWALRNWRLYQTFTPEYTTTPLLTWPSPAYGMASAIHNLAKTFWSVAGVSNDVGYPFPLVGFAAMALWVAGWQQPTRTPALVNHPANGPLRHAFRLALAVNFLLVLRFGYLFGMGQGRHLFPLLFPLALALAAGWGRLPVRRLALWATAGWLVYALGFAAFSLSRFPR